MPACNKVPTAMVDERTVFLFLFMSHVAGLSGSISHRKSSLGRLAWKRLTALLTPDSLAIVAEIFSAAEAASGVRQKSRPSVRFAEFRFLCGIGRGPAPAAATIFPQKGWLACYDQSHFSRDGIEAAHSPKKGTMKVGLPLSRPHAVVPAPP